MLTKNYNLKLNAHRPPKKNHRRHQNHEKKFFAKNFPHLYTHTSLHEDRKISDAQNRIIFNIKSMNFQGSNNREKIILKKLFARDLQK